jgi:hypothetical protein
MALFMQYVFYRHILRADVNFTDPGNHQTLHFKSTIFAKLILNATLWKQARQEVRQHWFIDR